jgi:signal transduction histidine kinase
MTIVLVIVLLFSIITNIAINKQFEGYIINQEQVRREKIIQDLQELYNGNAKSLNSEYLHTLGMNSMHDGYFLSVYDSTGKIIWDAETHDMSMCKQIMNDITKNMNRRKHRGGFKTYSYDLMQGSQKIGIVSIKSYGPYFLKENEFQFINSLNVIFISIGLVSFIASIVTGGILAKKIAHPITKTAEITKQISSGDYSIRFEGDTKTRELSTLISSINNMAIALDRQEQHRKQLTSDIAHELRTPLTAIRSHLEAMAEGLWDVTPERLNSCVEEVKRLSSLVVDLDRLAKLEQENLKQNITTVDLLESAGTVYNNFEKEAHDKDIEISIEGITCNILADKDRITQVITNLLSNAIKYSPKNGHIKIQVKDDGANGVVLIEDNGIGISQKDLPYIFERFYRTDQSRNRKTGGAGIGLTIAKSIVEAHKGRITVESTEGKGSSFTVVLPKV